MLILVPALFWMITGQVWEDFLITFRQAANLVQGNGLTYHAGERLHSFTSPLNVLIPALMAWLTGSTEYDIPLLLYNLVSIACLCGGGLITVKLLLGQEEGPAHPFLVLLFPLILVLSIRVTAYAVNGQEAGFWVLFLAISIQAACRGHADAWITAGVGWGGLMWTRPDSPVHIALIGLLALVFPTKSRKAELVGILKAATICTVLYLPWFAWAWWYYGSPVPHTVMAKSGAYKGFLDMEFTLHQWLEIVRQLFAAPFLPVYFLPGDWPPVIAPLLAVVSLLIILSPFFSNDRLVRLSGFLYLGSLSYLEFMELTARSFPWYYVPPAFFGALSLARIAQLIEAGNPSPLRKSIFRTSASLLVLFYLALFAGSLRQLEYQQRVIENGVRRSVGLYIKEHMQPGDRVYVEPLGYIGYYSGALMLDFPGLVSRETVEVRKAHGTGFLDSPRYLEPDWLVLRPHEAEAVGKLPGIMEHYDLHAVIDKRDVVKSEPFLPGRGHPYTDAAFYIFKRK